MNTRLASITIYGMQISPRDIENVILRHPGVADVTAVGVADAVVNGNGQLVKAVVVLKSGYDDVTSNQLLSYANRRPNSASMLFFFYAVFQKRTIAYLIVYKLNKLEPKFGTLYHYSPRY